MRKSNLVLAVAFTLLTVTSASLLNGCSHARVHPQKNPASPVLPDPKMSTLQADQTIDMPTLEKNCETKNAFACMARAEEWLSRGENEKALDYYQRACDLDLPASCSEASVIAGKLGKKEMMFKDAAKSCRMNSTLGCYNLACYYCAENKNSTATLKYLNRALVTGFNDRKALESDPDLACVKSLPEWKTILAVLPVENETNKTEISGVRHIYYQNLGLSFVPVPGFKFEPLPGLIRQTDTSGAQVLITGVSIPFKDSLHAFQTQIAELATYKLLKQSDLKVNGFDTHFQAGQFEREGMNYILINYITGNEDYTAEGSGTYLSAYQTTFGDEIRDSVTSIILSPWQLPSEHQIAYENLLTQTGFKFAGIGGGQIIYNRAGNLKEEHTLPVVVINPIVFGVKENKLDANLAKSIFQRLMSSQNADAAAISNHHLPKIKSVKLGKDRESFEIEFSNLSTHLKAGVMTLGVRGKKLMPGLVWTFLYDPAGASINVPKVVASLRSTKIKAKMVQKFKENEEDAFEVEQKADEKPAPSAVGTGAIHEG